MVILLTGASGFIGSRLAAALQAAGHQVVRAVRHAERTSCSDLFVEVDFVRDIEVARWLPRLAGIDVVINAVGIIRERGNQTFEALHHAAPKALFAACSEADIELVIQISALGADEEAQSAYHRSKKAADDYLASLDIRSVILQPSLVYGAGGASAGLFNLLASLPVIALPGGGWQRVQPVHIDDVVAAALAVLSQPLPSGTRLPVVGLYAISFRQFLGSLRRNMGLNDGVLLAIPMPFARLAARAGDMLPGSLLGEETLQMLERGNTADAAPLTALLQRPPLPVDAFIAEAEAGALRLQAQLGWLLPLLRLSIAVVWIVTGIVSLGLYPVQQSYLLLERVGFNGALATLLLYGAALMDIGFGVATLALKRRRLLWLLQIAVIVVYTIIITVKLPEFWLHPYGPLLKNLPMLMAIWLLFETEKAHGLHRR
ncbi:MAG TPA: SDR family oxidoreductase [Methylophilaceae bacterium]|nr:SDR family oxidoreductase [Methylophilaceae bacterium]